MAGGTALRVPVNFVQVMQRGGGKRGDCIKFTRFESAILLDIEKLSLPKCYCTPIQGVRAGIGEIGLLGIKHSGLISVCRKGEGEDA